MLENDYFYLCDVCGNPTIIEAEIEDIGYMAVVCNDCARDYEVIVRARQEPVKNYGGTG